MVRQRQQQSRLPPIFSGLSTSGGDSNFNHVQNKYYAFKWNGNDKGVIFQLSAAPVTITGVSRTPPRPAAATR